MAGFTQAFIDGILQGGVYATVAVGLSLVFGVMRMINWAHGETLMWGLYISFLLISRLGIDPYIAMIIVGAMMFFFGFGLQKFILNKLLARDTKREPASVLLFTAGLGIALSYGAQMIFGSVPKIAQSRWSNMSVKIGSAIIVTSKLISFVLALLFCLGLYIFLKKTETGRAIRATSQNRHVAKLMGINESYIYCLAFAIGTAIVGISAGLLSAYYPATPTVGEAFSSRSFIIVVLGGKGSVLGSLVGGLIIGMILSLGSQFLSTSYAEVLTFLIFVAVLVFKPSGLLSKEKE